MSTCEFHCKRADLVPWPKTMTAFCKVLLKGSAMGIPWQWITLSWKSVRGLSLLFRTASYKKLGVWLGTGSYIRPCTIWGYAAPILGNMNMNWKGWQLPWTWIHLFSQASSCIILWKEQLNNITHTHTCDPLVHRAVFSTREEGSEMS